MPKVSIVVPSKNCAQYMDLCLDSIQEQTLDDIEILCVDAFSTDGTREIIQKHQAKDDRIKLLNDDKGSSGYADNLGFKTATGKYVGIVEADDFIKPEMMEVLYALAEGNQLDYIKADLSMFVEKYGDRIVADNVQSLREVSEIIGKVIDTRKFPILLELDGYQWKGIYRRSFIIDNDLWLNETKGAAYQDNGFLHKTIMRGRRVMYIPNCFYQYRRDNENSSDYNPRGVGIMAREYQFIERDRVEFPDIFKPFLGVYYLKMFHQFMGQVRKAKMPDGYRDVEDAICVFHDLLMQGYMNGALEKRIFKDEYVPLIEFLKHPQMYVENLYFAEMELRMKFQKYLDRLEKYEKNGFVIVSCGDRGKAQYMLLARNLDTTDIWICDNSKVLQGNQFGYHDVESVEEAVEHHPDAFFIITNEFHWKELKRQLKKLGVSEERCCVFDLPNGIHFASSWTREK